MITKFNNEVFKIRPNLIIGIKRVLGDIKVKPFKLIPIENSAYFYFASKRINRDPLNLPKLYVALTYSYGESDNRYDNYKGSYSFMFQLEVWKNNRLSKYYYHLYHYRSYIEFSLYHIVPESDSQEPQHIHKPDDELFSDDDICAFSFAFCDHILKRVEDIKYIPESFIKYSDSNLMLFGYLKNEYFVKDYDDQDEYEKEKCLLQEEILKENYIIVQ